MDQDIEREWEKVLEEIFDIEANSNYENMMTEREIQLMKITFTAGYKIGFRKVADDMVNIIEKPMKYKRR